MDRGLSIPFRVYEEFQPLSSLKHEDSSDTLSLTLPGYRKEQIKVQIDSFGTLKITGERPLGVSNKWSQFRKDFRTPANCKTGEIRAKFENEVLNIIMPKTTTGQPPTPAVNVTSTSRPSDQVAPPTSANPTPKTTTTTPTHDHKPTSTESPKLPPPHPPPPMVAPPSQKLATEARVSPNKPVAPPCRKPADEANFSPMKPVAPPNQKPVPEPILPTPKPQVLAQMPAGTNAEALLPRKNPAHDYEDRKTTKTEHHHHHHNAEEKKNWTSSSSASGSSSSNNTSSDDDSDDEHKHGHGHEHEHAGKGKKEDEIENYVHGGDGAVVGKLKKKKDELIQKMSDYRRQSGGATGGGMNMTSMMENYKHKFEGFMMEMKKKKNPSTNDGEISRSDLVVNMAVASLVVVALGVYVTWSFKSIHLE
ncbi:hypothetical protein C5167_003873 [Papaver somniferum]|uniref:SHSP domain-containing protein n=1 Tax=Papaver somniferum TaxID=3469 RepID=A0A4Y7L079_PAPSO|nr:inactive protein RESTRICTED TEV MOVEMENT 2-like [Papaver somniferum]RZC78954.1 hypothetical protein C5167_003873 [Papaver somniferum]